MSASGAQPPLRRVLGIVGPTACGKTAAALALARALPCEIISMDSALVYRGMDIGTAKPSPQERAQVPHHLIDVLEPTAAYSAAEFCKDAARLIEEINQRGNMAVLVGGTMLYLRALTLGLDDIPAANATVRAQLDVDAAQRGWPALHAELREFDPVTAARLPPTDSQRIQRALEVFRSSGKPLSAYFGQGGGFAPIDVPLLSLEPLERSWLHERIAQRLQTMFDGGLVAEVRALRERGDLSAQMPAMRCVGYRQVWQGIDAGTPPQTWQEAAAAATRQLAKRQMTWLRSMPSRQVVNAQAPDATGQTVAWALGQAMHHIKS